MRTIFLIGLFLSAVSYASNITVNSDVNSDTTWAVDTVFVAGDVTIADGILLTIESGTKILFSDHYKLNVLGAIHAQGAENDSIVFSPVDTMGFRDDYAQNTGSWSGIEYPAGSIQTDTSQFEYCVFQYAKATEVNDNAYGAVFFATNAARIKITNSSFRNNTAFKGGGAIYAKNVGLQISDTRFIGNYAYNSNGGAVYYFTYPEFNLQNCYFEENKAYKGGAVYILDVVEINIDHCVFHNNFATKMSNLITDCYGGAISIYRGLSFSAQMYATITHNQIIGSRSTSGAVYFKENVIARIEHNTFAYNFAGNTGAGISHGPDCNFTIKSNIFTNNEANTGAALYYYLNATGLKLINNLFANNYARDNYASYNGSGGGAVSINNTVDTVLIINNTFVHNRHDYMGGALHLIHSKNNTIINNIFYGNSAPRAPQIAINTKGATNDSLLYPDLEYNCIQAGSDSIGVYRDYDVVEYDSVFRGIYKENISDSPQFVMPSAGSGLDYDGLTSDWSLKESSPCINAGNPFFTIDSIGAEQDLAGNLRIYMFDEIKVSDIGAYEFQGVPNSISSGKFVPVSNILYQNYPNPFNPETVIRYQLGRLSSVQIDVFNSLGQKIKALVKATQPAGIHTITFNATGIASGIYYYQLSVDNNRQIRKMVLVK